MQPGTAADVAAGRAKEPSSDLPTWDVNRLTALATNTGPGQLADLELRHRRGARCEDRIRTAKDNPG